MMISNFYWAQLAVVISNTDYLKLSDIKRQGQKKILKDITEMLDSVINGTKVNNFRHADDTEHYTDSKQILVTQINNRNQEYGPEIQ